MHHEHATGPGVAPPVPGRVRTCADAHGAARRGPGGAADAAEPVLPAGFQRPLRSVSRGRRRAAVQRQCTIRRRRRRQHGGAARLQRVPLAFRHALDYHLDSNIAATKYFSGGYSVEPTGYLDGEGIFKIVPGDFAWIGRETYTQLLINPLAPATPNQSREPQLSHHRPAIHAASDAAHLGDARRHIFHRHLGLPVAIPRRARHRLNTSTSTITATAPN